MNAKTIFGIDLGTTYSCISYIDEHGQPVVVPNNEGDLTTPSVVYFEDRENVVVGKTAKDAIRTDAPRVVSKVKREMGNAEWRFPISGTDYRPEQISALVLKKVVGDAAVNSGKTIEDVVITCPAYFGSAQKEATKKAGEIAGLNVRYVIPEPTAAAIAFGAAQGEDDTVLVYDLGGGTFDITLIDIKKGALTVLSTDGDAELGGYNWDTELTQVFAHEVAKETGADVEEVTGNAEFYAELLLVAEDTKKRLTSNKTAKQVLVYGGERIRVEVTREEFDAATKQLLDRTIELTRTVIDRAKADSRMTPPRRILLVGGSTYMPQVRERIEQEFPGLEIKQQDPNLIVAKGAAIYGLKMLLEDTAIEIINKGARAGEAIDNIQDANETTKKAALAKAGEIFGLPPAEAVELGSKVVGNVTSRSFGVKAFVEKLGAERISNLVHVDDRVPISVTRTFGTLEDRQSSVSIKIFENEVRTNESDPLVEELSCILLAEAELDLGGPFPKNSPIEVKFQLSADGILDVTAKHTATGRKIDVQMKVTGVMSDEEVDKARSAVKGLAVS
jgi:molecular chaperone DnaK (HSP70)